jgi:hypothetical protein
MLTVLILTLTVDSNFERLYPETCIHITKTARVQTLAGCYKDASRREPFVT